MSRRRLVLSKSIIAVVVLSCYQPPTIDKSYYEEPAQPVAPTTESTQVMPEIIQEDIMSTFTVKPISQHARYASLEAVAGNVRVWGIDGNSLVDVDLFSGDDGKLKFYDFLISGSAVYFQVETYETGENEDDPAVQVIHYYSQTGDVVTEIEAADYPDKPERERVTYDGDLFKIVAAEYDGDPISQVYQGPMVTAYLCVDSYFLNNDGLWFSVSEGTRIRPEGIYFYEKGASRIAEKGSGRVW